MRWLQIPLYVTKVNQVLVDYTSKCGKFIALFQFGGNMNLWACFLRISIPCEKSKPFSIAGGHLCYLDSKRGSDVTLEKDFHCNSCTETGESDDSLSDLGIDSQDHIQPFMFDHGSTSEEDNAFSALTNWPRFHYLLKIEIIAFQAKFKIRR